LVQAADALDVLCAAIAKRAVAVNCLVTPTAMLEFAGVTAIETKFAPVIVVVAPKH
jgi:hypothetical protein